MPNTPMKDECIEFGVCLSTSSWAMIQVTMLMYRYCLVDVRWIMSTTGQSEVGLGCYLVGC